MYFGRPETIDVASNDRGPRFTITIWWEQSYLTGNQCDILFVRLKSTRFYAPVSRGMVLNPYFVPFAKNIKGWIWFGNYGCTHRVIIEKYEPTYNYNSLVTKVTQTVGKTSIRSVRIQHTCSMLWYSHIDYKNKFIIII